MILTASSQVNTKARVQPSNLPTRGGFHGNGRPRACLFWDLLDVRSVLRWLLWATAQVPRGKAKLDVVMAVDGTSILATGPLIPAAWRSNVSLGTQCKPMHVLG